MTPPEQPHGSAPPGPQPGHPSAGPDETEPAGFDMDSVWEGNEDPPPAELVDADPGNGDQLLEPLGDVEPDQSPPAEPVDDERDPSPDISSAVGGTSTFPSEG